MATQATARPTTLPRAESTGKKQPGVGHYISLILSYLLLFIMTAILLGPFILAFLGSFKTGNEVTAWPPTFLPNEWHPENYARVWNQTLDAKGNSLFPRWLLNSVFLAATRVVLQVFLCSLAAYAFARLRFPGRGIVFTIILATLMVPGVVLLIPRYLILNSIKIGDGSLINTYWAIIIPGAVGAGGIFLLTQFFRAIPKDLEEAAAIDGASLFTTYWRIVLPLATPALATLAILEFQGSWNSFQNELVLLNTQDMFPLTVGLASLKGAYTGNINLILAASMFNTIPAIIIFIIFSRYFVQGSTYSGVKG